MNSRTLLIATAFLSVFRLSILAADPVFSGPQPGEKVTSFQVIELTGDGAGQSRDPIAEYSGAPAVLVFVHGLERSLVPLLRVVDEYGALRKDRLSTDMIFLSPDRLEGERRVRAASGSLKLQSRVGLSPDGIEGPGNYGLNKDCLITIIAAKDDTVMANFALVQPGIADAPSVVEALAKLCGDDAPPAIEELNRLHSARTGAGRGPAEMRPEAARGNAPPPAVDWEAFDLETEAGLRSAVRALIGEVQTLRNEIARRRDGPTTGQPREEFPGAVPSDAVLQGLLRRFIQPTNDAAAVDALLQEAREHIGDDPGLRRQAIDGWTRILHFGDRYGTGYARQSGRAFLAELQEDVP
ncbi:MAG TPA: hypothetical protein VMN36_04960 [Verrucomicrobiales bacterium]|nr:hypothetical protein [Verrucomicrobiales bacterium]